MPGISYILEYTPDAVPVVATSGNVAAAAAVATIPAVPGRTAFITGFHITSSGATAAAVVLATLAGLVGGVTLSYAYSTVAGATLANPTLAIQFTKPIPAVALAAGTPIVLTLPSLGAGNTNAVVTLFGFYL